MNKRLQAFSYYGGKNSKLRWLLPLLPARADELRYVEPFGGSLAVAINRRHPRTCRVYVNDIDGWAVNFFRALRQNPDELIHRLRYTPKSEEEFVGFGSAIMQPFSHQKTACVESARVFAAHITQCYGSIPLERTGWAGPRRAICDDGRAITMKEIARVVSKFFFHNSDALKILKRHHLGCKRTLIYLDPPYVMETRSKSGDAYKTELDDADHCALIEYALAATCRIAISGYSNHIYDQALAGWQCHKLDTVAFTSNKGRDGTYNKQTTECVWTNYDPHANQSNHSELL